MAFPDESQEAALCQTLEIDLGGPDRSDFGTVRHRVVCSDQSSRHLSISGSLEETPGQ